MLQLNTLFFSPEKNPLALASAFLQLFSCMTRPESGGRSDHNEQYYQRALEYITNNYSYNLRIQDIADYIGVDRTYLYKIFMREAQISPKQYLLQSPDPRGGKTVADTGLYRDRNCLFLWIP